MGWEWVLLLVRINHSEDKVQETDPPSYPLPPPSWCCIFTTCYYWVSGWVYVTTGSVWICVTTGTLYSVYVSSEGYLFFLKIFVESDSRELSKTRNK